MRKLLAIFAFAFLGFVALPYWSAYALAQAVKTGDRAALERNVDWDSVRASLSTDISAALADGGGNDAKSILIGALGGSVVSGVLDAMVTPDNVAALSQRAASVKSRRGGETDAAEDVARDPVAHVTWAFFRSHDEFVVTLTSDKVRDGEAHLFFERRGLSWPLVRIQLPDSVLSGLTS
ncbi:DUF2939 domain-containing protein [Actibacterium sp. 188UL27-1]|uniref:DUF2939 domain-containing protein n=1 Tax=Actibacterium sp. 188UL27-1 TaxID=2786961 RepID=UPI00195D0B37|nr:DUF2939 domain-containing protein [Actibacterium sp. 188UL27-1]MBM7066092.1 DUF2939 domain-containing protein [Actibacterium sp. 188UL27-1]